MLAILIARAKEDDQVGGLIPLLVERGVSILQYTNDDTRLFMDDDLPKFVNMKLILCIFEHLSRLKKKFHKSEIFYFGQAKEMKDHDKQIFGCEAGSLPL
jgi:hypothetical protein